MNYYERAAKYIDSHHDEMLADYKTFVNLESYTQDVSRVRVAAQFIKALLEQAGVVCEFIETGKGPTIKGVLGADRPGKPILFCGHMDTVFKAGTFGENPFRIEGGKAYGPGVLDMKGGIIIGVYVIKALVDAGYDETPIKVLFSGDEESGHEDSIGDEVLVKEGGGCLFAFNLETGLASNELAIGRRGRLGAKVTLTGVEAHSGNDFELGRSAVVEAAYKIIEFYKLLDSEKGTTANIGVIEGGTMISAIPKHCSMMLDYRFRVGSEVKRLKDSIMEIANHCYAYPDGGVTAEVDFLKVFPAFETTDAVVAFYEHCCASAQKCGLDVPGSKLVGGGSDAAFLTQAGTPTICSFGVQGENNHTDREYASVDSLFYRAKLICAAVCNQSGFHPPAC